MAASAGGAACPHAGEAVREDVAPQAAACQDCGAQRALRVCMTCGRVSCCESQQAHNRAHALAAGHPIIKPLPLGPRSWTWCYACRAYVGP